MNNVFIVERNINSYNDGNYEDYQCNSTLELVGVYTSRPEAESAAAEVNCWPRGANNAQHEEDWYRWFTTTTECSIREVVTGQVLASPLVEAEVADYQQDERVQQQEQEKTRLKQQRITDALALFKQLGAESYLESLPYVLVRQDVLSVEDVLRMDPKRVAISDSSSSYGSDEQQRKTAALTNFQKSLAKVSLPDEAYA